MHQNFDKFHEKEQFFLISATTHPLNQLRKTLLELSLQEMDDFFFLNNKNKTSDWESINLAKVYVFLQNQRLDLYEEEQWNKLELSYLFATLSFEHVKNFLDIMFRIADTFNLEIKHRDKICSRADLDIAFYEYRQDVRNTLNGEPGSKMAKINILQSYPRTK